MGKDFDSILDKCLSQIRTGEADIESCLAHYPEHVAQLRPLLETAALLWQKPQPQPRGEAISRGEQLVLEKVVEKRAQKARKKGLTRVIREKIGVGGRVPERRPSRLPGWRLRWVAVVASIVALFVLGGGIVAASSNSMPREFLYPVKIATEQTRMVLTPSEVGKAKLHIAFAERRMEEIAEMSERGQAEEVTKLVPMVVQHLEETKQIIVATGEGKAAQELKTKLEDSAVQQLAVLDGALQQATKDTKPVMAQALETSGESYGTAIETAAASAPLPLPIAKTGTIEIWVTDLPSPEIAHILIEVQNVEVHKAGIPDGWIPVAPGPESFDLMEIADFELFLGSVIVEPGTYTQIRMDIRSVWVITIDEVKHPAKVAGDKLKVVRPFRVEAGLPTELLLDFDASKSIVVTGAGEFIFKAVIRLSVSNPGEPGEPQPSINVKKTAQATGVDTIAGIIVITNTSSDNVVVESATDTPYWQVGGGDWVKFEESDFEFSSSPVLEAGTIIAVGESQAFNYEVTFIKPIPPQARELRNIIEVEVAGREKVFHDIVGFAPYGYVELEEAFFEGHVAGFDFLGGVPGNIWYDNLSLAVKKLVRGKGHRVEEQESFIAFRSHYLFQSLFCNRGEAHEKGLVENLVGYARRNFLVPLPKVSSFQELNQLLMERCLKEDGRRLRGKTRTIGELWQEERVRLLPLPEHAYPCCKICTVKPNSLSLVNFQTNRYSIPVNVAEEKLTLKAFVDRVEISAGEKVVAVHHRSYAHHEDILDPLHYLPLLRQRISAFPYAKPIRHWHWPEVFDYYLAALRERHQNGAATREFIQTLELCSSYPEEEVAQAMDQALTWHAPSFDVVNHILKQGQGQELVSLPLSVERTPSCPRVEDRGLAHYSQLLGRV